MATDEAALVVVLPDDDVEAIAAKVRKAGSSGVELLVPEGVPALRDKSSFDTLLQAVAAENVALLIISSDQQTLAAARESAVETVSVEGTQVQIPFDGDRVAEGAPASDADFLSSLDAMPPGPPPTEPSGLSDADEDFMSNLDDLSAVMGGADGRSSDDDFAASLDDLSDAFAMDDEPAGDTGTTARSPSAAEAPPPRPRIRPEDIVLTDEEMSRANRQRSGSSTRDRTKGSTTRFLIIALIILLVIIAIVLLWGPVSGILSGSGAAATIVVIPPAAPEEVQPIEDQPVARVQPASSNSDLAVQAQEVVETVVFTATGEVTEEVMTPAGTARGIVSIFNEGNQPINLPQGTEFIGFNPQGNQVVFTSDEAVIIPGSSTVDDGVQIITTRGQASVNITARSAGSASNIDAGTITQVVPPGQAPIGANSGILRLQHGPIMGGSEEPVRIVKETNVQQVLQDALTGLNNRARQELEQRASSEGLVLEIASILPRAETLSKGQGYDQRVIPPVGERVDPANPTFSLVVEGPFSALATPPGQTLTAQLQRVFPNILMSEGRIPEGMTAAVREDWDWDGSVLTVDGMLEPTGERLSLNPQELAAIENAVAGQPRSAAEAALNEFVEQGIIRSYQLPQDLDTLPERVTVSQQNLEAQEAQR